MGFLTKLNRVFSPRHLAVNSGEPTSSPIAQSHEPNADFTAACFVNAVLFENFGLSTDVMKALTVTLPTEYGGDRGLASLWINIYLFWILRRQTRVAFGDTFFSEVWEEMGVILARDSDAAHLAGTLGMFLKQIDAADAKSQQKVNDVEYPREIFVAWSFLVLTEGSPFHGRSYPDEGFGGVDFDLAETLINARDDRMKFIEFMVANAPFYNPSLAPDAS